MTTSTHREVAALMLGRPLAPGEVVHHINGDHYDNRPDNLRVFNSNGEHMRWHGVSGRQTPISCESLAASTRILTQALAGRQLGVTRARVGQMIRSGILCAVPDVQGGVYVDADSLRAYLRKRNPKGGV